MPILKESELDIISHSIEQTQRFGMRLGALLNAGDIVCLSGDMGAGKTVLASGIGNGWGATTPITSPTFNLVHEHRRKKDNQRLFHLDCYRLEGAAEADTIGIDDVLDGRGPVLVEWPEHIDEVLPKNRLWVELRVLDTTRRNLTFEGHGPRYEKLIEQFREATFGV
ncbi:MAG: tRNA (adenosine(37)-N6)-threonylcarbamoyltransferase complex ATPase subunit type 1 TsaE [Anaerolineaceae bacterium]|nr:tRNA (adenosine(37)-N6)-threonylcarbamoyltransferase complex ATPase subunit type 1 TsaE [Anaerolineaceae bacterium]